MNADPQSSIGHRDTRPGRWRIAGLLAVASIVIASVAVCIFGAGSSLPSDNKLTYKVARGNLLVTVRKQGLLESSENKEVKCKVRGYSTVIWVIESGTHVEPGDELVRLDTLDIEETVAERSKYAHWSRSAAERARADVARAELAILEYEEGRYRSELMTLEKDLIIAESELRNAADRLEYFRGLAERGYVVDLEVEEKALAVRRAELSVGVKETEIETHKGFTRAMEQETLKGELNAAKANLAAAEERAGMDAARRDLARDELGLCVVTAEASGMIVHPSAARWHNAPKIEEGAAVHKDQVLLLMPDLSRMQVKLGIHESRIDRIKPGLSARVTLPNRTIEGKVSTVASVTAPAAIWTGYKVEYETTIALPEIEGLMPGMSADVEIIVDRHDDVLTIPIAATVETDAGAFCWVKTDGVLQRRTIQLGDTNDVFTIVKAGLTEGEEVMLNAAAFADSAETKVVKRRNGREGASPESAGENGEAKPQAADSDFSPKSSGSDENASGGDKTDASGSKAA